MISQIWNKNILWDQCSAAQVFKWPKFYGKSIFLNILFIHIVLKKCSRSGHSIPTWPEKRYTKPLEKHNSQKKHLIKQRRKMKFTRMNKSHQTIWLVTLYYSFVAEGAIVGIIETFLDAIAPLEILTPPQNNTMETKISIRQADRVYLTKVTKLSKQSAK